MNRQMSISEYIKTHPLIIFNISAVIAIAMLFGYQMLRPIDVLRDWEIELAPTKTYEEHNGEKLPVYHPNESLVFSSHSEKLISADGAVTRNIICDATSELGEREITLDIIPASRRPGERPERASSIIIPDVIQFNRLPRVCRLSFDIVYNVHPFRTHSEFAESQKFIVKEKTMTIPEVRKHMSSLEETIKQLEGRVEQQESQN